MYGKKRNISLQKNNTIFCDNFLVCTYVYTYLHVEIACLQLNDDHGSFFFFLNCLL